MAAQAGVKVKGLRELDRALGKAPGNLRGHLRDELRTVAGDVAVEARSIAESKNLRDTGDLIASIKPFALTGRAGVRVTAKHLGYPYPGLLEYRGRTSGGFGPLAFLNPAVENKSSDIQRGMEHVLDRLSDDFNEGIHV